MTLFVTPQDAMAECTQAIKDLDNYHKIFSDCKSTIFAVKDILLEENRRIFKALGFDLNNRVTKRKADYIKHERFVNKDMLESLKQDFARLQDAVDFCVQNHERFEELREHILNSGQPEIVSYRKENAASLVAPFKLTYGEVDFYFTNLEKIKKEYLPQLVITQKLLDDKVAKLPEKFRYDEDYEFKFGKKTKEDRIVKIAPEDVTLEA
ncbi:MAG: hypothetical protein AB7S44_03795 [Spirochaetales bacterium]